MSTKDIPALNCVGMRDDSIVFEIDRETVARLVDEWEMIDDESDAVAEVVETGVAELDSLNKRLREVDERDKISPPAWRDSA